MPISFPSSHSVHEYLTMEEKASMENAPKTRYECQKDSTATHLMIGDTALWKQFCDDNDSGNYDFRKTISK